jgi:hypothetical protein
MRYFILFVLLVSSLSVFAGGYPTPTYLLKSIGSPEMVTLSDSGKISTNKLVVGETHIRENAQSDYNTPTNSSMVLMLADDVIVSVDENSEFKLHSSTVNISNRGSLPSKSVFSDKNHVASLMSGTVDIINSSTNGVFLLQTPRVTITIRQGKCRVIVQSKTTVVVTIEGSMFLHKLVDPKDGLVDAGKYAHVTTYYSLLSKGMDTLNNGKATATIKQISIEDVKRVNDSFDELSRLGSNVIFVESDNKTIGVKIR